MTKTWKKTSKKTILMIQKISQRKVFSVFLRRKRKKTKKTMTISKMMTKKSKMMTKKSKKMMKKLKTSLNIMTKQKIMIKTRI